MIDSNVSGLETQTGFLEKVENKDIKVSKVKKTMGRPKGALTGAKGLALNKRLLILRSIAEDDTEKSVDRISAINLITALLNDKVIVAKDGTLTTTLKFELSDKVKAINNDNGGLSAVKVNPNVKQNIEDVKAGTLEGNKGELEGNKVELAGNEKNKQAQGEFKVKFNSSSNLDKSDDLEPF